MAKFKVGDVIELYPNESRDEEPVKEFWKNHTLIYKIEGIVGITYSMKLIHITGENVTAVKKYIGYECSPYIKEIDNMAELVTNKSIKLLYG